MKRYFIGILILNLVLFLYLNFTGSNYGLIPQLVKAYAYYISDNLNWEHLNKQEVIYDVNNMYILIPFQGFFKDGKIIDSLNYVYNHSKLITYNGDAYMKYNITMNDLVYIIFSLLLGYIILFTFAVVITSVGPVNIDVKYFIMLILIIILSVDFMFNFNIPIINFPINIIGFGLFTLPIKTVISLQCPDLICQYMNFDFFKYFLVVSYAFLYLVVITNVLLPKE